MKNKYDTSVVFLYAIGKEDLLPIGFRQQIPYSTISTWRQTDYSKYIGHEFRYFFDDAFDKAELLFKYSKTKKAMMGFARSWFTLAYALKPIVRTALNDRKLQKDIINAINYMRKHIGLKKALKLLGLSKTQYHQWVLEARFDCFDSFTQLCVKRHPQQLEMKEIMKMKKMLIDPSMDHYPIVSIQSLALRKKDLVVSLYSWYKYSRLWGMGKRTMKKDRKTVGIISKYPNEYLHVDTTFYPLIDGKEICISFVMDNFSKMILGFHVSDRNTFDIVRNSMKKALKVIATHPDQRYLPKKNNDSLLVTDGGRENHNKTINKFIAKLTQQRITKVRALKDIRFSNSPVEAIHRTIKSRYLKNRKFENIKAITNYLEWAVKDYNEVRPHYKHRPRTPFEVYFDIPLGFDVRERVKAAIKLRVKHNKCAGCMQCTGFKCQKKDMQ